MSIINKYFEKVLDFKLLKAQLILANEAQLSSDSSVGLIMHRYIRSARLMSINNDTLEQRILSIAALYNLLSLLLWPHK